MQNPTSSTSRFRKFRSSKWFIYTAVYLAVFTDMYLQGLIIPILPFSLAEYVHVEPKDIQKWTGILVGLYGGGYIVGSPVAGFLADNLVARRIPYMFGLVALAASTIMFSLGRNLAILVVARLFQGVSSGFTHSIGTAVLADTVGDKASGKVMGFLCLTMAAAMVVGPVCGGVLYHHFGYQAVFVSAYVLMGLDVVSWVLMIERKNGENKASPSEPGTTLPTGRHQNDADKDYGTFEQDLPPRDSQEEANETNQLLHSGSSSSERSGKAKRNTSSYPNFLILLARPRMQAALLGAFMQDLLLSELSSTLPLRMKMLFHFNSQSVGTVFLFLMLANFSSPFLGAISDRAGANVTITAGFALLTPLWILLRLINHDSTGQIALLYVLLTAIGIGLNLVLAPVYTEAKLVVDEIQAEQPNLLGEKGAYATSFALLNMSYAAGCLLGPILGSTLVERAGWGNSTLIFGILCALCTIPSFYAAGGKVRKGEKVPGEPV